MWALISFPVMATPWPSRLLGSYLILSDPYNVSYWPQHGSCCHRQHCSEPTGFFGPRQLSGDMPTWGLWQAYHGEALRCMITMHHPNIESWQCWRLNRFNTPTVRTCWFSGFLVLLLCAVCVCSNSCWCVLKFGFCHVVWFHGFQSSLSTLMCVGLSARGSVWKMLKVREGHVLWSCHADCQTDSAPTTVTIRSWNRSSVLDTMYRSLRTFLPLWHKGLARVRTCKLQSQCTSGKSN